MAGETIFMLPFFIPRLYRPLILQNWNLSNTDIGTAFGAYGVSAMISYLLGGPLADKYPPRKLISLSLLFTGAGGFLLYLFPSRSMLIGVYFYFGISTILLLWGALIKVTHIEGGETNRASAMGILDSGRGLIAAVMSSTLIYLLSLKLKNIDAEPLKALNLIYLYVSCFTLFVAVLVWLVLGDFQQNEYDDPTHQWDLQKAKEVFKKFDIWLLGLVILSSYCGYKSVSNYSIYLVDVHGQSIEQSSRLTSLLFWLRPISALIGGFGVDFLFTRKNVSRFKVLWVLLFLSSISQLLLGLHIFSHFQMIFTTIVISASLAYTLRAVYFAVFGDLKIEDHLVGTAIGIASIVGFLPDMFFGATTGYLIDNYKGVAGYSYSFYFTSGIMFIGFVASFLLDRRTK
jgi:MFS family permease